MLTETYEMVERILADQFVSGVCSIDGRIPHGFLTDQHVASICDINPELLPLSFREALRDPRYPGAHFLPSEEPFVLNISTAVYSGLTTLKLGIIFADRESCDGDSRYEFRFKDDTGFLLKERGFFPLVMRNGRLHHINGNPTSSAEEIDTFKFGVLATQVVAGSLDGQFGGVIFSRHHRQEPSVPRTQLYRR